jgi:hypothetical protein
VIVGNGSSHLEEGGRAVGWQQRTSTPERNAVETIKAIHISGGEGKGIPISRASSEEVGRGLMPLSQRQRNQRHKPINVRPKSVRETRTREKHNSGVL